MELVVANMPFIEEINQKYDQFMIELDNNSISYFVQ